MLTTSATKGVRTDAAFCKRLRELRKKCEAATTPEAMGELTRLMLHDPRLTQCSMAGAGMNLTVESEDIKKAERTGDVEKMSPIRVDDVVAAQEMCQDASTSEGGRQRAVRSGRQRWGFGLLGARVTVGSRERWP